MILNKDTPTQKFVSRGYELLDLHHLGNEADRKLAVLRKVQFRNTVDDRPFVRLTFEDVNGFIIIGRMFDCDMAGELGTFLSSAKGALVLIDYETSYYKGDQSLSVKNISAIPDTEAASYAGFFVGKYSLGEVKLRNCYNTLSCMDMPANLTAFMNTYCNLEVLTSVSHESIGKGLRGYVLDILDRVLTGSKGLCSAEATVAFLLAVLTWFYTRKEADIFSDRNDHYFIASMLDHEMTASSQGLIKLSGYISEFTALFVRNATVISSPSYLMYNLFRIYSESSNIAVLETRLPVGGFCTYKNYTIRRY